MKTYLVPIDFSEAAFNAADFAAHLSHKSDVEHIILMNAYYISPYEALLPDPNMVMLREEEIEENAADRIHGLNNLKNKLLDQVREGVEISIRLNRTHLLRAMVETVSAQNVNLVILGSVGNSTVRENNTGIGSHVIGITKVCPAPVIVVPPAYHFQPLTKAVIACDFKKVSDSVPAEALNKLLGKRNIQLLVVNVNNKGKQAGLQPQQLAEETALHQMLKELKPKYHYINHPEIITGVLEFAAENDAQLVIALPHRYSFLQSLLHNSISQQLATSSSVPVLLMK